MEKVGASHKRRLTSRREEAAVHSAKAHFLSKPRKLFRLLFHHGQPLPWHAIGVELGRHAYGIRSQLGGGGWGIPAKPQ